MGHLVKILVTTLLGLGGSLGTPAEPKFFEKQLVDHFGAGGQTYTQRYYENSTWWKGPGHPIICIMGGEGAIKPSTGIFYPWVTDVIAKELGAYVVEPEHRFYGESMPLGAEKSMEPEVMAAYFNPQQALADAANFLQHMRRQLDCSETDPTKYCPVITIGGSYPGFLSAMMRLRYPGVVDIGYSASAPMKFYSQEIGSQFDYYQVITNSAEKSVEGCSAAVRNSVRALHQLKSIGEVLESLWICYGLPDYLIEGDLDLLLQEIDMIVMYTFANLNMGNYPPDNDAVTTKLRSACREIKDLESQNDPVGAIRLLLHDYAVKTDAPACFDMNTQVPAGRNGTISGGDWSGCGAGTDGQSWDFQTCTFLVEQIGTNGQTDMFHPRNWTWSWLGDHCAARFGVQPQPRALADLWGFDSRNLVSRTGASRIIFTNGLNDGWSVGGITEDLSDDVIALNIPNGAHHSDLSHDPPNKNDTDDVTEARAKALDYIKKWLEEIYLDSWIKARVNVVQLV